MQNDLLLIAISIVGGFLAGGINTLAGNGSAITLGILTDLMGLAPNIANATNRIGVLAQGITSSYQMAKKKPEALYAHKAFITIIVLGSIFGVYLATIISNDNFKLVYKYLMVLMLIIVLIKPDKWIKSVPPEKVIAKESVGKMIFYYSMGFLLGIYGGFIQLGMGIFFLATMVLVLKKDMKESNLIKVVVVGIYTAFVLAFFAYKGMVDWRSGLFIAIGQAAGGWVIGKYAANSPYANKAAYIILIVVIIMVIINQFFFT